MDLKKIIPKAALMLSTAIPFSQPAQALESHSTNASDLLPKPELQTNTQKQITNQNNLDKKKEQLEQILRISKPETNTYCATETSNDSIGSKPVRLNDGQEATNDWGRNTKLGKLTDSSSVTASFGDINFNPDSTTYVGGSVSGIGLNSLANDAQAGFHRTLNSIGFNTNEDPPVFDSKGPTGAALGIGGGVSSNDLIPNNPINFNTYITGEAGIGHTDFNGTLPYAKASGGLELGYSLNRKDSDGRIPRPNGTIITSEVNNSKEVTVGVNAECSTNDQTDFLNARGKPNDFCAVTGEIGVNIPVGDNSAIKISSETPFVSTPAYKNGVNTSGTPIQIRYQKRF